MASQGVDPTIAIAAVAGTVLMAGFAFSYARDAHIYRQRWRSMQDFDAALHEHECMVRDLIEIQQGEPMTDAQRELVRLTTPTRPLSGKDRKRVTKAQRRIERELAD